MVGQSQCSQRGISCSSVKSRSRPEGGIHKQKDPTVIGLAWQPLNAYKENFLLLKKSSRIFKQQFPLPIEATTPMVPMQTGLFFWPGVKGWNPKGAEAAAGEILETMNLTDALLACCLQHHPQASTSSTLLQIFAPTKISSSLSKLDVVKSSDPDLLKYVVAIIKGVKLTFL